MLKGFTPGKIYLATGYTDLRRGIDGLAGIVQEQFKLDAFDDTLFLFCGRRSDRIKGLYWDNNGFVLLYKRLEDGTFRWPRDANEARIRSILLVLQVIMAWQKGRKELEIDDEQRQNPQMLSGACGL